VFAFSVLPAMAALALTNNLALVFALATVIGAFSGAAGYAASFRGELPVGATQTAMAVALLALALGRRAVGGLLSRRVGRSPR
jgi:zinc transport system permease protein